MGSVYGRNRGRMPGTAIESSWVEGFVCTVDEDCPAVVVRRVCRIAAMLQGVVTGPVSQLSKSPPINRLVVPREIQGVPLLYSKREVGVSGPCDPLAVLVELSCGATLLHTGVVRYPFRTPQGADKRNPRQGGHDPPYTEAVSEESVNLTKQALLEEPCCVWPKAGQESQTDLASTVRWRRTGSPVAGRILGSTDRVLLPTPG